MQSAEAIPAITLDDFCQRRGLTKVDFIKIDTDGHELSVLLGARSTLATCRPSIIFEIGLYLLQERGTTFSQYFEYFSSLQYTLRNARTGRIITLKNYHREIPLHYTTDLLALPLPLPQEQTAKRS